MPPSNPVSGCQTWPLESVNGVDEPALIRIVAAADAALVAPPACGANSIALMAGFSVWRVNTMRNSPLVTSTGTDSIYLEEERRKIRDYFFANGIPSFLSEPRAFAALAHLSRYKHRASKAIAVPRALPKTESKSRKTFLNVLKKSNNPILDEIRCKTVLKAAGLKVTLPVLAASKKEAVAVAEKLGYPVVMKIVSPQITHKSDIGGVKLKLQNKAQVGSAFDEIMDAVRKKAPSASVEGVSIQKMADPGLELVIGITKDPQFGPMLMFGLGGTSVEILKDVAFRIVPLTKEDAGDMIRQIKGYRLLGRSPRKNI